jgi:hypothetical protein
MMESKSTVPDRIAALAEALHDRYAGALCISDLDMHTWTECDAKPQWLDDAAAILAALYSCPETGHYVDGCKCWLLVPGSEIARFREAAHEALGYLNKISPSGYHVERARDALLGLVEA